MPENTVTTACPATGKPCAVHQSFAETASGFQVQETCPDCGAGRGFTVTREAGLKLLAEKEAAEQEAAKQRERAAQEAVNKTQSRE